MVNETRKSISVSDCVKLSKTLSDIGIGYTVFLNRSKFGDTNTCIIRLEGASIPELVIADSGIGKIVMDRDTIYGIDIEDSNIYSTNIIDSTLDYLRFATSIVRQAVKRETDIHFTNLEQK